LCGEPGVPPWSVVCGECWHYMPADLRIRLQYSWRHRVIDNGLYQETLAEAMVWAVEHVRPTF
jgi:hypothetical protein